MNPYAVKLWPIPLLLLLLVSKVDGQEITQKVVQVTGPEANQPNEVSVAINPENPENIVIVSMQREFDDGAPGITNYAYVTKNGGSDWKQVSHPNPGRRTQGDDAIAFSSDGTAYHSYISFSQLRADKPLNAANGIFITRSENGGEHWSKPIPVVDHINTVVPFEDKPWLAIDRQSQSNHTGNIYLSWTRFDRYGSSDPSDSTHIFFSKSTDGAKNFLMPYKISDRGGNARDSSNTVEGAVPAIGPEGTVYIAWAGPRGIEMDRSTNGGNSFGKDVKVADNPGGWDMEIKGINRANGFPVTGTDVSDGPHRGSVYVNWVDQRHGDPDVFLARSRDHEQTWSDPVRVNNDAPGNGKEQFFTWMSVDPVNGHIYIVYYDRSDLTGTKTALTLARSSDGGKTFSHHSIDQSPFTTSSDVFFGDYIGIDAYDGHVTVAYQYFTSEKKLAISAAIFKF